MLNKMFWVVFRDYFDFFWIYLLRILCLLCCKYSESCLNHNIVLIHPNMKQDSYIFMIMSREKSQSKAQVIR